MQLSFKNRTVGFHDVKEWGGGGGKMKNQKLIKFEHIHFAIRTSIQHCFRIRDHEGGSIWAAAAQL